MAVTNIALTLCANFRVFPDNTQLGPDFSLSGFDFAQPPGSNNMFVNVTGGEKGLQFPPEGVEITLPWPVSEARLRVGTFSGPVEVTALDSTGSVVRSRTVPGTNSYVNLRIFAPEIASLILSEGGGEGILVRICVTICGRPC
jgi:hypothetical protein